MYLAKIRNIVLGSHNRTKKINKNIIYSFGIKGYAMFIQFALVPLTLHYLDKFNYGIWLVLASILEWFSYFDIGIGHGLRNKLSEALAKDDVALGKTFTSTAYALVSIIFLSFILVFAVINQFLDWSAILNVPAERAGELNEMVFFVFIFFCIRFIVSLITPVLYANQDPAINNVMGPLGSTVSLIAIFLLSRHIEGSLFWVAIIFSGAPLLVMLGFSIVLYSKRYKKLTPSLQHIDFSYSKSLLGLGLNFFIIHISMLVLFSSTNMVLTQLFGPDEVTVYNIAYRYFTVAVMLNGIITLTYWSPFTEAYVKRDFEWIKKSIEKLEYISYALIALVVVMVFATDFLINLWVGETIKIPDSLKFMLAFYVIIQLLAAPFLIFINGASKIRLQFYLAIVSIVITIPLAILFCKVLDFGPSGVVVAMLCSTLPTCILWRIQYKKLITETAHGIWNE